MAAFQRFCKLTSLDSAAVIGYLKREFTGQPDVGIACVYCEYKQQQQQTACNLVASIWRQLCQHRDTLPDVAQALYNDNPQNRVKLSLGKVEEITVEAIHQYSKVFVVVDALDECTEEGLTRAKFASALQNLLSRSVLTQDKLHVMITSRLTERLVEGGDDIEIYATEDDLRKVVKRRITNGISKDRALGERIRSNETLAVELTENIIELGGKMYEPHAPFETSPLTLLVGFFWFIYI